MIFELNNKITLEGLKPETSKAIQQKLTIPNPAYQEAERMGRYTGSIPRTLKFYDDTPAGLICPRGAVLMLYSECFAYHRNNIIVQDNRRILDPVNIVFQGKLRPLQQNAVDGFSKYSMGLLKSPTGAGKTVMALHLIAHRKQPALIVVHTKELLNQWVESIGTFLGIQAADVGIIGCGKFRIGSKITVGMVQTLHKRAAEVSPFIGHLVLDECHRAPALHYANAIKQFDCKYLLGLTATPYRRDGLGKVIQWFIGPIVGEIGKQDLLDAGDLCQAEAIFIPTGFTPDADPSDQYSLSLSELTQDLDRNQLIADTVMKQNGHGVTLILSGRVKHCEAIKDMLKCRHRIEAAVLTGKTPAKQRRQIINDLISGKCRFLVATGSLIGEGFDLPGISTLALATPVKYHGNLIQYVGRALRPAPGKNKAIILDFVDDHGVFEHSAKSRWGTYIQQGIQVTGGL